MPEPKASRPHMPGYGMVGPLEGSGLLPWTWAQDRLASSHDYWVATVHPAGGPHVTPVWGVWSEGAAWFSSSPHSRKARNIARDSRVALTTDNPRQPVVVEGVVDVVVDEHAIEEFTGWVNAKYRTDIAVDFFTENACFRLEPRRAFGLDESDFTGSPTRWVFEDTPGPGGAPPR
jgi:PPOX class probable F420-dependent enzyme